MLKLEDFSHLQELIGEWAEFGQVDLTDWEGEHVMSVLSSHPEFRDKFVALLQVRLGEPLQ